MNSPKVSVNQNRKQGLFRKRWKWLLGPTWCYGYDTFFRTILHQVLHWVRVKNDSHLSHKHTHTHSYLDCCHSHRWQTWSMPLFGLVQSLDLTWLVFLNLPSLSKNNCTQGKQLKTVLRYRLWLFDWSLLIIMQRWQMQWHSVPCVLTVLLNLTLAGFLGASD